MKQVIPLVLLLLLALSPLGCHDEAPASQGGMTPAPPQQGLDLPELTEPGRVPARRVVHLLYTSNVDGEAEACG
jgi:hypothetical protein